MVRSPDFGVLNFLANVTVVERGPDLPSDIYPKIDLQKFPEFVSEFPHRSNPDTSAYGSIADNSYLYLLDLYGSRDMICISPVHTMTSLAR